jgi:hypothetical protein
LHETRTPNLLARHASREANERISVALLGTETDVMTVRCECGSDDCDAEMTLQREAYRNIRLKRTFFVVRTGHEQTSARVIARNGAFAIVDS